MADHFSSRDAAGLARRDYTLRPAHSLRYRIAVWTLMGALSATAGAAAFHAWHAHRESTPAQCGDAALDDAAQQTELARARLALAQESAARAAVQKTADTATADVARLNAELQFLRGQSKGAASRRR